MYNLAFLIQVRSGSTRMPDKMTNFFWQDKTIPEIILEKLISAFPEAEIVLATSDNRRDALFEKLAEKFGVKFFQGSENDVLDRFIKAAEYYKINKIVRICADNPFLDMKEMEYLISNIDDTNDYISFKINGLPSIKTHFGFWAEYVSLFALKKVNKKTQDALYREHVTNYIYTHPELFNIKFLAPNKKVLNAENVRMTIDTTDDFQNLQKIYSELYTIYHNKFGIDEILEFLESHKGYQSKMSEQIKLNTK